MAWRLSKFCPRMFASIAVFIFLSGSTLSEEATRCYWCGPLAEQVHRSQRSPACDPFHYHQTVCDKGFTHCAIIVSSPPYEESRLCVKFYQDECYSTYCNSTKTWRMVCACRGNLCNGNHTERETEAFAAIAKRASVARARIKRTVLAGFISVKTKGPSENNTIIIIQNKTAHEETAVQGDQPGEENIDMTSLKTNEPKHMEQNIIIEHGAKKDDKIGHTSHITNQEVKLISTMSTIGHNNDVKTDKATTSEMLNTDKLTKVDNIEKLTTENMEKLTTTENKDKLTINAVVSTSMKPTEIEVPIQKTSDKPPAEALQQNAPTKAMEVTTEAITTDTTHITTMQPTTQANQTKNIAAQNISYLLFVFVGFLLHFCL